MRIPGPIRFHAVLAAGCAFWLAANAPSFAQSQDSSSAAQAAKSGSTTGKKTSSAAAKKPASKKSQSASGSATHRSATARTASTATKRKRTSRVASKGKKPRGQQKIESDRVQAIQEALIREHYLSGEATGTWSQSSEDAMRRYQSDHGWQSKTVPDSRALIKLGLGPSNDHLLNPESAMTSQPDMPRATPWEPSSHSADPGLPVKAPGSDSVSSPQ